MLLCLAHLCASLLALQPLLGPDTYFRIVHVYARAYVCVAATFNAASRSGVCQLQGAVPPVLCVARRCAAAGAEPLPVCPGHSHRHAPAAHIHHQPGTVCQAPPAGWLAHQRGEHTAGRAVRDCCYSSEKCPVCTSRTLLVEQACGAMLCEEYALKGGPANCRTFALHHRA